MSDTDTKAPGDKTLHMSPKTLSLKRPMEQNTVRQSFSHGRSKAVVVETVKRRAPGSGTAPTKEGAPASRPPAGLSPRAEAAAAPATARAPAVAPAPAPTGPQRASSGVVLRTLSDAERDARLSALQDSKRREEEDRRRQEEEARRRTEREERDRREREAAEARKRDEDERRRQEDERKRRAEEEARRRLGEDAVPAPRTGVPQR